jgi:hypothetical protein
MKIPSILQIIFGLLTIPSSWFLADKKAHIIPDRPPGVMIVDFIPPDSLFEFVLVFLSLAVLICGLFQWKGATRYARLQIIFGGVMTVISVILLIRATTLSHLEKSGLYYVVYVLLVLGLAVCVTGLLQFLKLVKTGKAGLRNNT